MEMTRLAIWKMYNQQQQAIPGAGSPPPSLNGRSPLLDLHRPHLPPTTAASSGSSNGSPAAASQQQQPSPLPTPPSAVAPATPTALPPLPPLPAELLSAAATGQKEMALQLKALEEAKENDKENEEDVNVDGDERRDGDDDDDVSEVARDSASPVASKRRRESGEAEEEEEAMQTPRKRQALNLNSALTMPGANIKITSRGRNRFFYTFT